MRFSKERQARFAKSLAWGGQGFSNLLPTPMAVDPRTMARFFFERTEREPPGPLPSVPVADAVLRGPASDDLRVTWLGHSTMLIEIAGRRVLTDPVWADRASPFTWSGPKRFQPVPVPLASIPLPDVVLVSHDHYDHLDQGAVIELARRGARFVTALGVGQRLEGWGIDAGQITELDWWQEHQAAEGLTLRAMPARHFSGRSLGDRNETLWASWGIEAGGGRVFFGGDGGMDDDNFSEIGRRCGPFDLTMLEIGAYDPAWGTIHLGPENALKAHQMLRGKTLLPVHWGTFNLALHAWDAPAEELLSAAQATGARVALPRLGQSISVGGSLPCEPWWREVRAERARLAAVAG